MHPYKAIRRDLLTENAIVYPPDINGSFGKPRRLRHVMFRGTVSHSDDEHRSEAVTGKVYIDKMNTVGAYQVQAGSRIVIGGVSMMVVSVTRRPDPHGRLHHWELEVR